MSHGGVPFHLILSRPFVVCDHVFETVNIFTNRRVVNADSENNEEPALKDNMMDCYAKRMLSSTWWDTHFFQSASTILGNMNLSSFVMKFKMIKGKIRQRNEKTTNQ